MTQAAMTLLAVGQFIFTVCLKQHNIIILKTTGLLQHTCDRCMDLHHALDLDMFRKMGFGSE